MEIFVENDVFNLPSLELYQALDGKGVCTCADSNGELIRLWVGELKGHTDLCILNVSTLELYEYRFGSQWVSAKLFGSDTVQYDTHRYGIRVR